MKALGCGTAVATPILVPASSIGEEPWYVKMIHQNGNRASERRQELCRLLSVRRQLALGSFPILLLSLALVMTRCGPQPSLEWSSVKKAIREQFPSVPQLSTKQLHDWLASSERDDPILLDARTLDEYAISHLPGARLAPSEQEALRALADADRDHPIVVYCSIGHRSSALAERLQARGFSMVYNLEGSIFEWANQGRPVYRGDMEVKVVHPYDGKWGQLLNRALWSTSSR